MKVRDKIEDIIRLVEETGDLLWQIYRKQDLAVEMKLDATPVTEADKLSNKRLCHGLLYLFPEIPVVSEELNIPDYRIREKWERFWLIDPLDGTKEFIHKTGSFCINIALIEKRIPVFGMIYNICNREILWAFRDDKCYIRKDGENGEFVVVPTDRPALRIAVSNFNRVEAEYRYIDSLKSRGYELEVIPMGASAKHCEIAKGTVDIYPKFGRCYEWDTAAGQIIVEMTGGGVREVETNAPMKYNKEELVNPSFIMYGKRAKQEMDPGDYLFIP